MARNCIISLKIMYNLINFDCIFWCKVIKFWVTVFANGPAGNNMAAGKLDNYENEFTRDFLFDFFD